MIVEGIAISYKKIKKTVNNEKRKECRLKNNRRKT